MNGRSWILEDPSVPSQLQDPGMGRKRLCGAFNELKFQSFAVHTRDREAQEIGSCKEFLFWPWLMKITSA
ncbi:hypothetical protein MANES_12G081416v8 [Manihot esculenta]|uniref:Uncharacterized protein n=1 Tax=Manihot esculenta TaxID=3983 RepID=A0ACB7GPU4_MANES|nr:hypothetical protein MANES_12G081416v8 [Manihot esculenta]